MSTNFKDIDYSTAPKVLEVKNLRVNFKSDSGLVYAVRGVSFDLYKGETLCIVGESGSGKSVTSKTIMGILASNAIIESGQIMYEGEDLVRISEEEFHRIRGHKIGMIFQDPLSSLNPIVKVGKQITEATLINKNILKKHYNDLISRQLVAFRNLKANKVYEDIKTKEEIAKIKNYISALNDQKNPISEEKADEIKEFIFLFKKSISDEILNLSREIDALLHKNDVDSRYFEDEIKTKKLSLFEKKSRLLKSYEDIVNVGDDTNNLLNTRLELLNKLVAYNKEEFKTLNPLYKKALSIRKKEAKKENNVYAQDLKNKHEAKMKDLNNSLNDVSTKIAALENTLLPEEKEKYEEILNQDKVVKENFFKRMFKKKEQQEINISKLGKIVEKVTSTGNAEFDELLGLKKDLLEQIDKEESEYINSTKVTKAEAKKMAIKVMKEVGIPLPEQRFKQYPFEFSGGMRQRIVIAIALTADPDILICDEPTTALDVTIQAQILELINKLKRERGLSCIFITHDLGVVANMADRVAVMYAGKIVEYGTSYEIFYNPKHPYTWALLSSIPDLDSKEKLEAIPGTPPDMRFPPKGDAFALRSKYAMDIDFMYEPPFFKVSDTHYAATWLLHEDAPTVEMPKIVKTRIANSIKDFENNKNSEKSVNKIPEESFKFVEEVKSNTIKSQLIKNNLNAYHNYEEGKVVVEKDNSIDVNEVSNKESVNEIEGVSKENVEKEIINIRSKAKYKEEYVKNNVILSVNHLKQYFFFGKGPNRTKLKAVHDVSFQIKEGECFGVVGESGCGKTTTGRSIIGLYKITSGSIYYKGYRISAGSRWNEKEIKYTKIRYKQAISSLKEKLKNGEIAKEAYNEEFSKQKQLKDDICLVQKNKIKQIRYDNKHASRKLLSEIQMIFQDPIDSLDPRMTVEDIIQEGLKIQGYTNREENHQKVVEVLEKVGLIADYCNRYPHEFSGGQRQRIGIARALIMNPKLLICDEPISALDVSIRAQIINLLNDLKEEMGLSIMFIAHDLSVVKYFCDRIAVMYFGEVVELATSDELFKHPLHPYTKSLLSAIPRPNPLSERDRVRIHYDPKSAHDYSEDKPTFVEICPGHFILANKAEVEKYKEEILKIDNEGENTSENISNIEDIKEDLTSSEPVNEITSDDIEEDEVDEIEIITDEKTDNKNEPSETLLKQRSGEYKKVYYVRKVDGVWKISLKSGLKVIKTFKTKVEVLEYANALAKSQNGTVLVHASKGKNKGKFIK